MKTKWVEPDVRDNVVDFVRQWSDRTEIPACRFQTWIGISASKFYYWKGRFGKVNEHNAWVPRDHWITDQERQHICAFARSHPLDGYRRLTYMMIDRDIVACSPSTVYRVLKQAGLLAGQSPQPSKKGTGFQQPLQAHQHWHVDVSYLHIAGTFYYLCSVLDGFSRFLVHWEIREKMAENDVEIVLQKARERFPGVSPRIISDNGPQFIAKDFKEFIRLAGMTHVTTSPYYPQSNGKVERWHRTFKGEAIRTRVPLSLEDARRIVGQYVEHYNDQRLNSAIGYVTPWDMLEGRQQAIFDERLRKLTEARQRRQRQRQAQRQSQKQPSAPSAEFRRATPAIDFAALRSHIDIAQVLQLLGFQPRSKSGSQWRGACPLHGATRRTARCFSVNVAKHAFHCFKCRRHGNALDLWCAAHWLSPNDAALDLAERLHLKLPTFLQQEHRNREEEPVTCLTQAQPVVTCAKTGAAH